MNSPGFGIQDARRADDARRSGLRRLHRWTRRAGPRPKPSIFWRLFLGNALIALLAWCFLAFTPASIQPPVELWDGVFSVGGLAVVLAVNLLLVRQAMMPLARLRSLMRRVDPLRPGPRIPVYGNDAETVELTQAFNDMLDRLETERRQSAARRVEDQEEERRRVARELHDEVGQRLTGLLLQLEHAARLAPPTTTPQLIEAREAARESVDEVRRIARRLRPEALEELGLRSALTALAERTAASSGVRVVRKLDGQLPPLPRETELTVYRIAQEALTNAIRHARATTISLRLEREDQATVLRVVDDGVGLDGSREGAGLLGMRERALLIGGELLVGECPGGGVEIRLAVPLSAGR
jgi:two-component system, NarL family, sensor histidine kinase UhpB